MYTTFCPPPSPPPRAARKPAHSDRCGPLPRKVWRPMVYTSGSQTLIYVTLKLQMVYDPRPYHGKGATASDIYSK